MEIYRIRRTVFGFVAGIFLATMMLVPSMARADATHAISLAEAISRALKFAPTIDSATAGSDLGLANLMQARAPLYPSIDAGALYYQAPGYSRTVTNGGQTDAMLTLNYTAYDFGRRMAIARAARFAADASTLGLNAAQNRVVFDTTVAYFDLLRSRRAVNQLRASFERLGRYVAVIEQLERSGQSITNDVLRIRSERDLAELQLATGEQASRRAAIVLGSLIGDFDPDTVDIEDIVSLPGLPSGDLARNPILLADRRNIEAAKLSIKAAQAERLPNLGMQLTAGYLGINPPHTFNSNLGASYAGSVAVPVFDGGLIRSHIDAARARKMAAMAQFRQDELVLTQRLADAKLRYREAEHQFDILGRAQPTANDSFSLDWTRFLGGGTVTLLEVLDAFRQAETFRLQRIDQEFALRQAAADATYILGLK
ncbi:MAG: TolC family protein [Candidatus Binataceae bacterium]|nr:TolC family protein [Candidatus Binataceae bacterium]